jgi:hypothetical protein
MGFLDPSVVYSFFPLDDIFILIEGFFGVVLVVFKEAQRGVFVYMSSMTGPGALSLLSCCRHEDRGSVGSSGSCDPTAPHAPIYVSLSFSSP